ncbi:2-(hydroxymethyl)glutarate dehydrogenase [Capillimicrobium parvum]|uniref:2-(Hydroxymethyl)glutarate dehydrogenase n=2 Tax=Capillimicrobium parvum TaxID=2884022 RepID=A0A9E6XS59_9ACTN|nr:2-(hydroxymethyl)glutarate dehydrogenase [Capillimicrobium parvum]
MQNMSDSTSRPACGVLGAGSIGAGLARRLAARGHEVWAYDLDAARVAQLAPAGVSTAGSARELAQRADVILLALPDTPHILGALDGDDGLEAGLRAGHAVLVTSTVDPATPRALAQRLAPLGVDVLDTPISGGPVAAEAGTLAIMVGAAPAAFDRLRPLLESLGAHVVHVGGVGDGEVAKLVNNLMGSVIAIGIAEGLALAAKSGVDVDRVIEAVSGGSGGSWILSEWIPRTVLADRGATHFAVDLMVKDMGLVRRLAEAEGVPLAAGALAERLFTELRDAGHGGSDFSILAAVQAQAAGADLPERGSG